MADKNEHISQRLHDVKTAHKLVSKRQEARGDRNKRNFDQSHTAAEFKVGDKVFVYNHRTPPGVPTKIFVRWDGPWEVTDVTIDKLTYTLKKGKKSLTRHINQLLLFVEENLEPAGRQKPNLQP